jgi:hypothetical protein
LNYFEAHNRLDEVREGANYHLNQINQALFLTGDLDGFQPSLRQTSGTFSPDGASGWMGSLCETESQRT